MYIFIVPYQYCKGTILLCKYSIIPHGTPVLQITLSWQTVRTSLVAPGVGWLTLTLLLPVCMLLLRLENGRLNNGWPQEGEHYPTHRNGNQHIYTVFVHFQVIIQRVGKQGNCRSKQTNNLQKESNQLYRLTIQDHDHLPFTLLPVAILSRWVVIIAPVFCPCRGHSAAWPKYSAHSHRAHGTEGSERIDTWDE